MFFSPNNSLGFLGYIRLSVQKPVEEPGEERYFKK
jgi:hypothetical protein